MHTQWSHVSMFVHTCSKVLIQYMVSHWQDNKKRTEIIKKILLCKFYRKNVNLTGKSMEKVNCFKSGREKDGKNWIVLNNQLITILFSSQIYTFFCKICIVLWFIDNWHRWLICLCFWKLLYQETKSI